MNTYKKTYIALTFAVLFMFSFSYMLVPLYDIFCEITGLNGKTNQERVIVDKEEITDRYVTVKFTSTVANSAPFNFEPIDLEILSTVPSVTIPNTVTLHQAFPNPFNPYSKIPYF